MTKTHYIAIGQLINETQLPLDKKTQLVTKLALYFEADNPRFDKNRWKDFCGFENYEWRINLMSNKDYLEEKGTPLCCSPASETYWSM